MDFHFTTETFELLFEVQLPFFRVMLPIRGKRIISFSAIDVIPAGEKSYIPHRAKM